MTSIKSILLTVGLVCSLGCFAQPLNHFVYHNFDDFWEVEGQATGVWVDKNDGDCSNSSNAEFEVRFKNPNPGHKVDYNLKLWKVPLSHLYSIADVNGNYTYGPDGPQEQFFPDGFDQGLPTMVYSTGTVVDFQSSLPTIYVSTIASISSGYAYYITIDSRKGGIISGTWHHGHSESFHYANGLTPTSFDLVPLLYDATVSLPSFYGSTTVYEYLQEVPVLFDGAASNCETSYHFIIEEFDLENWQSETVLYDSPTFNSEFGTIQVQAFYPDLFPGKIYHFGANVGPIWLTHDYFFRIKQATVDANLPASQGNHEVHVSSKGGTTQVFIVEELCDNIANVILDGSGSEFEIEYEVEVVEVDASMNPVIGTETTFGPYSGVAPANINLGSFPTSKTYKATLFVRNNEVSQGTYFSYVSCDGGKKIAGGFTDDNEKTPELNVYPNPSRSIVTIELPNSEDPIRIEALSTTGKIVYGSLSNSQVEQIDVENLPNGIYILTAHGSFGVLRTKFIKN